MADKKLFSGKVILDSDTTIFSNISSLGIDIDSVDVRITTNLTVNSDNMNTMSGGIDWKNGFKNMTKSIPSIPNFSSFGSKNINSQDQLIIVIKDKTGKLHRILYNITKPGDINNNVNSNDQWGKKNKNNTVTQPPTPMSTPLSAPAQISPPLPPRPKSNNAIQSLSISNYAQVNSSGKPTKLARMKDYLVGNVSNSTLGVLPLEPNPSSDQIQAHSAAIEYFNNYSAKLNKNFANSVAKTTRGTGNLTNGLNNSSSLVARNAKAAAVGSVPATTRGTGNLTNGLVQQKKDQANALAMLTGNKQGGSKKKTKKPVKKTVKK